MRLLVVLSPFCGLVAVTFLWSQEDRPPVGEMVAATLAVMEVEKATGWPDPNRPNLIGIRDRAIIAVCLYSG